MTNKITYDELMTIPTYGDRLRRLQLVNRGNISPRDISNGFYKSSEWMQLRKEIITRDLGCDLAVLGLYINGRIIVHHIDPLNEYDIENRTDKLFNPQNLICVSEDTHQKIHYLKHMDDYKERKPGDTKLW